MHDAHGSAQAAASRADAWCADQTELLFPWVKPYYETPIVLTEGKGSWVQDADGEAYLDLFAGILTTSIGHAHPEILDAVDRQMRKIGHTSPLYITEPQLRVARQLMELSPRSLTRAAFLNSGTEAVETAVMAAQIHTGRSEIIVLRQGYSGRSALTAGMTGQARWRPTESRMAGIVYARSPYVYRSPLGADAPDEAQTEFFISDLIDVIETTTSGRPAALLAETIQGVGGFIVPPKGYLARAAEVIRSYGGLFISDEVQTGFGRTGERWFGIEHSGVEPDLMVMAKGIAGGFPVGATLARGEVAAAWPGPSVSTFGGNPISMAAAEATLSVMVREDVPTRAAARGRQLRAGLEAITAPYPWVGEVRGMGLMQALELVEDPESRTPAPRRAQALLEAARMERLLIGTGGIQGHVIRIGPSLLISEAEVDEGLDRLERALRRVG
jgi:4-aminobutyrate aminotransferase-like enzyme